jgi:hypothetical protein
MVVRTSGVAVAVMVVGTPVSAVAAMRLVGAVAVMAVGTPVSAVAVVVSWVPWQ